MTKKTKREPIPAARYRAADVVPKPDGIYLEDIKLATRDPDTDEAEWAAVTNAIYNQDAEFDRPTYYTDKYK